MLPLLIIFAAVIFILPALTKKSSSTTSSATKATTTFDAMKRVETSEQRYLAAHSRYTSHLADLVTLGPALAGDLSTVTIQLDVSSDGQTYLAQASSDVLSLVHAGGKTATVANTCTVVKSGKGVKCPASTPAKSG
jgi:competence protein ComGC